MFAAKNHASEGNKMVSAEEFREELLAQMETASTRGQRHLVVNAVELHVALGLFPSPSHHTASDVMEVERQPGDVLIVSRDNPSGLTIRYLLPRGPSRSQAPTES
jgi:hypothetical protein